LDHFQLKTSLHELTKEKWVLSEKEGYMRFLTQDSSNISVTIWNHLTVASHSHAFFEFSMIIQGSCVHDYRGVRAPLIPGDVLLIAPHECHSYTAKMPVEMINCQFYGGGFNEECSQILETVSNAADGFYDRYDLEKQWSELLKNITEYAEQSEGQFQKTRQDSLNRQGIIHLEMDEKREVEHLLRRMMEEQRSRQKGFETVKMACLQMILVIFKRIQNRQMVHLQNNQNEKTKYIYRTIDYMEKHLDEKIDLAVLASQSCWSEGHFRSVFKEVTGLSPVEYLNRLRIVKSLEYMEKENLRISEAAEKVGIYDPSYYSRLFKKVIGYSPRYFRKI
jgi:YesN/AraC family two-component response regulator